MWIVIKVIVENKFENNIMQVLLGFRFMFFRYYMQLGIIIRVMKLYIGSNVNFRGLVFFIGEFDRNFLMKEDCD